MRRAKFRSFLFECEQYNEKTLIAHTKNQNSNESEPQKKKRKKHFNQVNQIEMRIGEIYIDIYITISDMDIRLECFVAFHTDIFGPPNLIR